MSATLRRRMTRRRLRFAALLAVAALAAWRLRRDRGRAGVQRRQLRQLEALPTPDGDRRQLVQPHPEGDGRRWQRAAVQLRPPERLSAAGAFAGVERPHHRDADAVGDVGLLGSSCRTTPSPTAIRAVRGLRIRSGARPEVHARSVTSRSRSILDSGSSRTRSRSSQASAIRTPRRSRPSSLRTSTLRRARRPAL